MNRNIRKQYLEDDIIIYDSTDDEFDDEVNNVEISEDESLPDKYKNFEQHEIWDEVDGTWFKAWLPKGSVRPPDEQIQLEANALPITIGVVISVVIIILLSFGVSCWLYF